MIEKSGLGLSKVVLDYIASSRGCIVQYEKYSDVFLIDMGTILLMSFMSYKQQF